MERAYRTASVVKISLMVEVYRRVDRGKRQLDDRLRLASEDKIPGSDMLLHLHDGVEVILNDLIYLMISFSDNTATNMLIDLVGMNAVNDTMREPEMGDSNLGRKMRERPAVEGEVENLGTPNDYAVTLDATATLASSCTAMVEMLEKQQNARRIARFLPERNDLRWGSKTGSVSGVTNDVGFVEVAGRTAIVSAFCEGFPDQHASEDAIGRATDAAMRHLRVL